MVSNKHIHLPAFPRGVHLITPYIEEALSPLPSCGLLNIFIRHTSAALSINENYDPDVRMDLNGFFNRLVPENETWYRHTIEGPDDLPAHIKSSLLGASLSLPVEDKRLGLGAWQGIYLCEFRNKGGSRELILTLFS